MGRHSTARQYLIAAVPFIMTEPPKGCKYAQECERKIRTTPGLNYVIVRPVGFEWTENSEPEPASLHVNDFY